MKTRLRLFALLILLVAGVSGTVDAKKIALRSESDLAESRSETNLPIDVDFVGDFLVITVSAPLGNATVRILNDSDQVVFSGPASFLIPQQYPIDLSNFSEGDYTLEVIFPFTTLAGEFSLD